MKTFITGIFLLGSISLFAQPANDNRANAILLSDITSWSSSDAAYTTAGATPDDFSGGPYTDYKNVWFRFVADGPEIDIRVLSSGTKGTLQNIYLKLYDNGGSQIGRASCRERV